MDFRKTYYVLPNLFTLSSVLCGFVSIALSAGHADENLYLAALAICFGFFFDTADGRVARLTKTQTDLGRDLDSLADVITFGAAPALMVYRWGLTSFGRWGILVAGIYLCAGTLRLARFNVLSRREEASGHKKPGKYTLGLTIPASASVLVFMVIITHNAGQYRAVSEGSIAALVLVLSYLMVSRVRFRSFKDLRFSLRTFSVVLLLAGSYAAILRAGLHRAFIFMLLISAYIALGLAEEVLFFRRRRADDRAARSTVEAARVAAEEAKEDEEVLRELGAFDDTGEHATAAPDGSGVTADGAGAPAPKRA